MPKLSKFAKYHGGGNDFLLFEDLKKEFPIHSIPALCERNRGVGADGVILMRPSLVADFEMVFFNADGSLPKLCGNGLRCFVHFLIDQNIIKPLYKIEIAKQILTVKAIDRKIFTYFPLPQTLKKGIRIEGREVSLVDSGVPHLVIFAEEDVDVEKEGRKLRYHPFFAPDGANVNFVKVLNSDTLSIRTYERGVEKETLSCGTGSVATAFLGYQLGKVGNEVNLITASGDKIEIKIGEEIEVLGPSKKVFEGTLSLT